MIGLDDSCILYNFNLVQDTQTTSKHSLAGPPDGHLPDAADQDSAATAREAHVRFGESAQGIPEAPPRVVRQREEERKKGW